MNSPNPPQNISLGQKSKKTIGILGGTFDPIHFGHLKPAKKTAQWLGLEQLILLPAHIPAHKYTTFATTDQRVDMVRLACKVDPLFTLDTRETKRHSTSYTVDTLREIKQEHPDSIIYFLIGLDSLLSFHLWSRYQDILSLCHLVVNARPRYDLKTISTATQKLLTQYQVDSLEQVKHTDSGCIIFSPQSFHSSSLFDISSTEIRKRIVKAHTLCPIKEMHSFHDLVPPEVALYIEEHQLYRE
jgi:nicotinate-nucleotide adenylyltransferase